MGLQYPGKRPFPLFPRGAGSRTECQGRGPAESPCLQKFSSHCKEKYCILLYKCYNRDVLKGVTFMAQVMVNFRMDENVKKCMEQACREMGLSMTTAFTIFATKVGREKRIPFEITAGQGGPAPRPGR